MKLLNEHLNYDPVTGLLKWKKSAGRRVKAGQEAGSLQKRGYIHVIFKRKQHKAHRIAWFLHYGTWPEKDIDHINGVKNDNRIENLREVSARENQQNRVSHRDGRLVGCCFHKAAKKWRAQIRIKGKTKHLGLFKTEQEAHNAYKKYLLKQSL